MLYERLGHVLGVFTVMPGCLVFARLPKLYSLLAGFGQFINCSVFCVLRLCDGWVGEVAMSRRKRKKMWKKFLQGRGNFTFTMTCRNPGMGGYLYGLILPEYPE